MFIAPHLSLSLLLVWQLRFGTVNKDLNNTNIFEHSGKLYTITENHIPQEIDMFTLNTMQTWDVNGAWDRPFTSHPKVIFVFFVLYKQNSYALFLIYITANQTNTSYGF